MMKLQTRLAILAGALALSICPAAFAAGPPEGDPPYGPSAKGKGPAYAPADPTPGPKAGLPAQAKAYGRHCQGKSKKHVKGEQGTEFSRCVKAAAQLHKDRNDEGTA